MSLDTTLTASLALSLIRRWRAAVVLCSASPLVLMACGGETTGPAVRPAVPLVVAASALSQQGTVNRVAPSNPTVRVTDSLGHPQLGVNVQFSTGTQTWPMLVTGSDGLASVTWQFSQSAGVQTITAELYTADHVPLPREVTFIADVHPDTLAAIAAAIAGNQTGFQSQPAVTSPIVVAVDEFSNAIPGVEVSFAVTGGGSVTPASVITDAAGRASVGKWILGPGLGVDTLIATVGGRPVKPVYFTVGVTLPFAAKAIASGTQNTCAIALSGDVYCWGLNASGETHPGDPTPMFVVPTRVTLPAKMVSISGSSSHTCAISDEVPPQAYCWGRNDVGQLGTRASGAGPFKVPVPDGLAVVAAGFDHTCGLTPAGAAYCWGSGTWGQLGNGAISSCILNDGGASLQDCQGPVAVSGGLRFTSLAAGASHTCAVSTTEQMYCWGLNSSSQLGAASGSPCEAYNDYYYYYYYDSYSVACALAPQIVPSTPSVASVAAGAGTCLLSSAGSVTCFEPWGNVPVTASGIFASLSPDANCGIQGDGSSYCWNSAFDTGTASLTQPSPLQSGLAFVAITAGQAHRCGILRAGNVVMCWGSNDLGQLGNGTQVSGAAPAPVLGPPNP